MALRAGIIGLGILGQQHAECLSQHPEVDVVAVADIRADVVRQVGARFGAEGYTNFHEMFRAHPLDLVVVATPDPLHREPVMAAIEAGVPNIIEEKPFATTLEDAIAMYEAVERAGTRLFVDFANRASTLDIATRYVIQQGLLGQVVYGESRLDDNIVVPTAMWGDRSRDWAAGSSPAHFLLSHVVDLLRWYFAPAEVTEVYAITQRQVLGITPDLYDAFLTFDSGLKVRVKAEWIKHIDELVEFYMAFSGSEGTLIYHKRPGFGSQEGWRANLSARLSEADLLSHQEALLQRGISLAAIVHHPAPTTGQLSAGGEQRMLSLERRGPSHGGTTALIGPCIDAILEDTLEPERWRGNGPLPTHVDGLRQVQIVDAIIRSSERGEPVTIQGG